jgi:hypothetical protein
VERICEDALARLEHARNQFQRREGPNPRRTLRRARRAARRAIRDWRALTRTQLALSTAS